MAAFLPMYFLAAERCSFYLPNTGVYASLFSKPYVILDDIARAEVLIAKTIVRANIKVIKDVEHDSDNNWC